MSSYADLKRNADIVAVIGRHVHLSRKGTEYRGHCPFHNDKSPSFLVNARKGVWGCFVCGVGGDVIDFLKRKGMEHEQIIKELGGGTQAAAAVASKPASTQVAGVRPARIKHPRMGEPVAVWEYHNAEGELWGLVCRFETAEGKQVLPYTCHAPGASGAGGWKWAGFDEPRPLWNLPEILARPEAPIIIVEGEKAAEAAKRLYKAAVASCWQGGTNAWRKADWGVVAGRKVILWPDNDEPGRRAMAEVAAHIAHACDVQMVQVPDVMPAKWDVADADWTPAEAKEWLRGKVKRWGAASGEASASPSAAAAEMPSETINATQVDGEYFHVLGFVRDNNKTSYVIYTLANKVVNVFSAGSLDKKGMIQIAPLDWWESYFPAKRSFDTDAALNWIVRLADERGVFSLGSIRGRGAWMDEGRVVLHAGTHLVVDGVLHRLGTLKTRYIYEQGAHLPLDSDDAMTDEEAGELFAFISSLNFARPLDAMLLAGWIALAPVCGMLRWRPHIWVTGAAGSGKSWILSNLIRDCLGEVAINVQGETTEPGLRQMVGNDALPIVFDEAEGESAGSRQRIDGLLSFARAASTGEGGMVAKGGQGGKAHTYAVRTMMAMASILPAISLKSDVGRFSVLEVVPDRASGSRERWAAQLVVYRRVIEAAKRGRFVARVLKNLPVLLANIEAASAAVAEVLGDQRAGDQLGALLAGAFLWTEPRAINVDSMRDWLARQDLSSERMAADASDEETLVGVLLGAILKLDGSVTRTVFELAEICNGRGKDETVWPDKANDTLLRHGFKPDGDWLLVSDSHVEIRGILAGTQFARNHARTLMRLEGAESVKSVRFKGPVQRATKIFLYAEEKRIGAGAAVGSLAAPANMGAEQSAGGTVADGAGYVPF